MFESLASCFTFRCASLNSPQDESAVADMTALCIRSVLPSILAAAVIVGATSIASAKDSYKFDASSSTIGFSVHQFLGTTRGKFSNFNGRIEVDREHPESSSVTAQIDVRSIDTQIKRRDDHLRSAEFFNVEKFPRITFKSRTVKRTGSQSADILGDLTMHGVTKPITIHVKLLTPINETGRARWSVTTDPITRRDYNLMFTPAAESLSGISQTVAINIEIEAKRSD
ncbi:MAG: YceI family protein [Nitrospirota bacterium]